MSSSNQPPRMVNFPSLLVSEDEEYATLENPGGSTVHSWINADFVPSWLRPFTLDQNTRFTRTPDHFLRPPEEPQAQPEPEPLPSYGTAGASWHFLEMPLDVQEDALPVPSVKADIAALEQAFSDLPALRATRENAWPDAADSIHDNAPAAEGWSVDESGVETVLSWHDAPMPEHPAGDFDGAANACAEAPGIPSATVMEQLEPTVAAIPAPAPIAPLPCAYETINLAPATPLPAAEAPTDPVAWAQAPIPDGDGAATDPEAFSSPENTPMACESESSPAMRATEPAEAEAPSAPVFAPASDDTGLASATPIGTDALIAEATSPLPQGCEAATAAAEVAPSTVLPQADAAATETGEGHGLVPQDAPATAAAAFDGDGIPGQVGPMFGDTPLIQHPERAPETPAVEEVVSAEMASGEPSATDIAMYTATDDTTDGADDAHALTDSLAESLDDTPLDGTLAQLAAAALEDATARLEAAAPQVRAAAEDVAPAHLRPLTRMIVVGRLVLPPVREQDLAPRAPEAPAAEADAATRAASQISAHFAWQPYHLSINSSSPAPATAEEAAGATVADTVCAALPANPASPEAPAADAAGATADVAHNPFAYHLPPLDLLREPPQLEPDFELSEEFLDQSSAMLQQILRDFGIRGEVIDANPGPVVTLYEFEPAPGVKSSRVIALAADIARSMSAISARVAVVEGRNVIGIELPNRRRDTVWLRELLASQEFEEARSKLGLCLGKTIGGVPVITDLARMPHLLVAGTTGSGKSVAINTMILSLLYRHTPEACRLIMIDPKMLELSVYEGIPHLLTPVVTDPKKAIIALKWAVKEMEDRYRKMARLAVRNIDGYNARMAEAREKGEVITRQVQVGFDKESGEALYEEQQMDLSALPYIVIIVDEMADLMMVAGKEIEGAIQRLAQMARAAGIHLVMATQRPSVDVITGTIKANFPTRISFQVTSKIDSRTILGEMGAETLLGQGDMLFMAGGGRITRVHGPFVSDHEVEHVVAFLKAQGGPEYLEDVVQDEEADGPSGGDDAVFDKSEMGEGGGDLYDQAVAIVLRDRKASTSYIQRRLQVGYNKAASLMERMENEGIVGPANHAGKRDILSFGRDRDDER
ncbi:DNA translocase FtsK [Xanthobacter agilis]|uniref:DNA translocase FtsK n=1 Tax=Xanthobacter agilis TaxID=47492 RepID=UPI00372A387B